MYSGPDVFGPPCVIIKLLYNYVFSNFIFIYVFVFVFAFIILTTLYRLNWNIVGSVFFDNVLNKYFH